MDARLRRLCGLLFLAPALPSAAMAAPPPDLVRQMVEAALQGDDPVAVNAVVKAAIAVAPGSASEIQAMKAGWDAERAAFAAAKAEARQDELAEAGPLQMWKTDIELGGNHTTGSTDTTGVYGSVRLNRPGVYFTQNLSARVDYQRDAGAQSVEHVVAAYEPRYHINDNLYGYGLAQYEHDQPIGLQSRYVAGVGLGLKLAPSDKWLVELDAGPSFRHAEYAGFGQRDRVAARGGLNAAWKLSPTFTVKAEDAVFFEQGNSTASSTTSLETQLFGPLKARLSYNLEYESDAPGRPKKLDTITRATFVYSR